MRCWRTFDIEKRYGFDKVIVYSILLAVMCFLFSYALLQSLFSETPHFKYFPVFLAGLAGIYPLHKLIHLLPVFHYRTYMKCRCKFICSCLPIFSIHIKEPVPKRTFMLSLILPFLTINPILLACVGLFPHYTHYFAVLIAFHTGLCLIDLLYVKALITCPQQAVIEEHDRGYEILIPQ
ncbi:DUF3267 domain-containing protein [Bacillus thermotolerans]|uniref:DUF3267 domain-containing protein n=1 Tax=Bacillus thermotolerans TaxID=1221996 RepID=UPI0005890201|nr:DUF3267 domain-containing protein [Bacillus thermotolerans]KKB41802.1 hypothetical protein QY96_01844 [Bacillus thermotolerans]